VTPHLDKLEFPWLVDVELTDENAHALALFIGKDIEAFFLIVIEQAYDVRNIVEVI
jgi:hypothetical protein